MKFQARKYNNKVEKNTLYILEKSSVITFIEKQEDKTCDYVEITFDTEGEIYYCEAFRPNLIPSSGHKAADILGMMVSDDLAEVAIYDVKRSFKCDDEIIHYIQQVNATYYDSLGMLICARYSEAAIKYKIGVITSSFPEDIINSQKQYYLNQLESEKELTNSGAIAIKKQAARNVINMSYRYKMLEAISKRRIILENGNEYDLDIIIMNPFENGYKCEMKIC